VVVTIQESYVDSSREMLLKCTHSLEPVCCNVLLFVAACCSLVAGKTMDRQQCVGSPKS